MSVNDYSKLFEDEMEIYRQIDAMLVTYGENLNPELAQSILDRHREVQNLFEQQSKVFAEIVETPDFKAQHPELHRFINRTVTFSEAISDKDKFQFYQCIFKLMQKAEGIDLVTTLNKLHQQQRITIDFQYSKDSRLLATTVQPLRQQRPSPLLVFLQLAFACAYRLTSLFIRLIGTKPKTNKQASQPIDTDIRYPRNFHQQAPVLYAGKETKLAFSIPFIDIAHELLHCLHFALGSHKDTHFPHLPFHPITLLYSKYFRPDAEEYRTIEADDAESLTENSFRRAFGLSERGSYISAPLTVHTKPALDILLWISERRKQRKTIGGHEMVNLFFRKRDTADTPRDNKDIPQTTTSL